jgi:class 3 adenylate cyclase
MSDASPRRERKLVTVVFADLVGFTARAEALDPEDVEAILRPYHQPLRGELERFGGTVEKFIGDAVMAVFGAPTAHEDDPERAVRAALAIRDWAREAGDVEVRIAVNTGEALVSLDARPEAGEAMVAGDVVNTAARLQSAAPVNGVLVGETVERATRNAIDYGPAEPVAAKGKAEPVPVWEAVAARAHAGIEQVGGASLVGRERELDALAAARRSNARGRAGNLSLSRSSASPGSARAGSSPSCSGWSRSTPTFTSGAAGARSRTASRHPSPRSRRSCGRMPGYSTATPPRRQARS